MRRDYQQFIELNCEVLVVSPDPAAAFARLWQAEAYPFRGLPDPQHRVLQLYQQRVDWLRLGRLPAQVLVDRAGVVRFLHYGKSMADIADDQALLQRLARLDSGTLSGDGH